MIFILLYWRQIHHKILGYTKYRSYVFFTFFITLGCLSAIALSFTVFIRLTQFVVLLSIPILAFILSDTIKDIVNVNHGIRHVVEMLIFIICIIGFSRESMYAYKFFVM